MSLLVVAIIFNILGGLCLTCLAILQAKKLERAKAILSCLAAMLFLGTAIINTMTLQREHAREQLRNANIGITYEHPPEPPEQQPDHHPPEPEP